ncbi:MAG: hypothetical protein K0R84_167 [Clostridia bacterium]|nr:hypothetical protein [Clostridia bacterium]
MSDCPYTFMPPLDTTDTTRLFGNDIYQFNTYVTKFVYPDRSVEWRPNAVILAPSNTFQYALTAVPIMHFPINAPVLLTDPNSLNCELINEIKRLDPTGKNVPAKVIAVGPLSPMIKTQLDNIGYSSVRIGSADVFETAAQAMEFRYRIPPEGMEGKINIIVASAEEPSEGIAGAYFSAHMGVPILLTRQNALPQVIRRKLEKYSDKNVYIMGSEKAVSAAVENEIRGIVKGKVARIAGATPVETAVRLASFHDEETMFGWNIKEPDGWTFAFGETGNWANNIAATLLAHLGKHSALLYVDKNMLPGATRSFVLSVNPEEKHPPKPPYMHGYVLGNFGEISYKVQVELEKMLILMAGDH